MKLAVFDWNGTILADTTATVASANKEIAIVGHEPIDVKSFRNLYDVPISVYFERIGITLAQIKEHGVAMAEAFHADYEQRVLQAHTRAGARQALDNMHSLGITRIILSNHQQKAIGTQLSRLRLDHHFEAVLANDQLHAAYSIGKEDRLRDYLSAMKIESSEAFIIGDTLEEIRIGTNLGLKTIALTGGNCARNRLKAAKPDVLIDSLHDLIPVMEEWK